ARRSPLRCRCRCSVPRWWSCSRGARASLALPDRDYRQPVVTTGRTAARAELGAALDAALDGRGRLVLLTGEPGMGKTTLARDLAAQARRVGAVVRWAACWSGGATVAHAPWLTLLAGLGGAGEPALGALLGSDEDDPGAIASARASAYA